MPGECVDAEGSSGLTGDLSESTVQILNGGGVSELIRFLGVSGKILPRTTIGAACEHGGAHGGAIVAV